MSSHARGSVGESSRDRAWVRARRCASAAGGGGRPRRGVGSVRAAPRAASGRTHQQHIAAAEPEEPRRRERQEDLPVDVLQRRLVTLVETRRDAVLLRRDRCRGTQMHADACGADAGMHGPRAWEGCVCACAWEGVRGPLGRRWRACDQTATRTVPTSGFMYVSVALLSRCSSCMLNRGEKSLAWAASGWKGTASRWGLRRWAPPHECGGQPQASRCSLMSLWWPAMARPRRPL